MEGLRRRIAASRAATLWSILPLTFVGSMVGDGVGRIAGAAGGWEVVIRIVVTAIVLGGGLAWIDGARPRRSPGEE